MGRKIAGRKLARNSGYRRALYRNLVTDLLNHEKITTTEAKASQARGLADKMISLGKEGGLHSRRRALAFIFSKKVTDKLFDELATRYADRAGGYTRTVKLGPRLGDVASMVQLELVK